MNYPTVCKVKYKIFYQKSTVFLEFLDKVNVLLKGISGGFLSNLP